MLLYTFRLQQHLDLCVVRLQDASRYNVRLEFQMGALSRDMLLEVESTWPVAGGLDD